MAPLNLVLSYSTGAGYPVKKRGLQLALAHLKDLEFLGPELSCAHAVWLTQEGIQLLADSQTSICHNPSSNLRLKNGVAPVNRLLKQGVNVALERDESGEARVIPVILRDCLWADSTFSKLLALPKDSKPVTSWPNLDEAFTDVARGIRQVALELMDQKLGPADLSAEEIASRESRRERTRANLDIGQSNQALNQIDGVRPNVVFNEARIGPIYSSRQNSPGTVEKLPVFDAAQIWFQNDLDQPQDVATARQVAARIIFWDELGATRYFEMPGKWIEAVGESLYGWTDLLPAVDIEANGRIEKLVCVIKYPEENCCYGYNGEGVGANEYGRKDQRKRLTVGSYRIQVSLKGNNMSSEHWFKLTNEGIGGSLLVEPIEL